MASFREKAVRGKRSGDGREARLAARSEKPDSNSIPGRSRGEGMQAKAWSSTSFEKLKSTKDVNNCSSSTSPETDPGASSVFPFFTEDDRAQDGEDEEGPHGLAVEGSRAEEGTSRQVSWKSSERKSAAAAKGKSKPNAGTATANLQHRNPMFHAANVNAEPAVASLFPGEGCEESTRSAMNGSNPMFRRNVSQDQHGRPRAKSKPPVGGPDAGAGADAVAGSGDSKAKVKTEEASDKDSKAKDKDKPKKKKKEKTKDKAMYEYVGRMNVRPFLTGDGESKDAADNGSEQNGIGHGAFRMDTFARNEGEDGSKAHFKFVFTLVGVVVPTEGEDAKKLRPVLDAIHDRSSGNLRVRVNDGREITATATGASPSAVEVALNNIGVVLFNPKTVSKGHHLYTLSLNGRTLFSVLA
eukprot:g13229.t1